MQTNAERRLCLKLNRRRQLIPYGPPPAQKQRLSTGATDVDQLLERVDMSKHQARETHASSQAHDVRADKSPASLSSETISRDSYEVELRHLQVELVKLQRHFIRCRDKILVILEGRDAAGKDGAIKRVVEHLSPRETRVVALGKPSDRELHAWYFQRYVPHLPVAEELVLFNRSWYNRAGVEHVMGFCTPEQYEEFLQSTPRFEEMLANSGIKLLKYYLDITKDEQARRLEDRKRDPLKQWKISSIDEVALKHWKAYTRARDAMLLRTHTPIAPWYIVRADNKKLARLNLIRDMLSRLHYGGKNARLANPDPEIVFEFEASCIEGGVLAK